MPIPVIKPSHLTEGQRVKLISTGSTTYTGRIRGIASLFQPYMGAVYIVELDVKLPNYEYSCTVAPESNLCIID